MSTGEFGWGGWVGGGWTQANSYSNRVSAPPSVCSATDTESPCVRYVQQAQSTFLAFPVYNRMQRTTARLSRSTRDIEHPCVHRVSQHQKWTSSSFCQYRCTTNTCMFNVHKSTTGNNGPCTIQYNRQYFGRSYKRNQILMSLTCCGPARECPTGLDPFVSVSNTRWLSLPSCVMR